MSSNTDETAFVTRSKNAEFDEVTSQRRRYIRNKFLHDVLIEMTKNELLDSGLYQEVKNILSFQDVLEGLSLKQAGFNLLGLNASDLEQPKLSYQQGCKLGSALKEYLSEYYQDFCDKYPDLIQADLCTKVQDKVAKDLKEKLNRKQQEDYKQLTQVGCNLNEIIRLRTVELPKIVADKLQEYELKMKITEAKNTVLNYKMKVSIFTEVEKCPEVYQELIRDIYKQQEDCHKNIEELTLLKEKYATVHSKEFESILQKYLQYKSQIQAKQAMLSQLQKK